jgi:hypothetical protein
MANFKKNLGFNLLLIALGVTFVAGCVVAILAYRGGASSALLLQRARKEQAALLQGHAFVAGAPAVSLNEDNVTKAAEDVKALEAHVGSLRAAIAGNPELAIKGKPSANSAELSALLRESVDGWRKLAADNGIKLSANEPTAFGFHRYIHNQGTSPKREFQKVDQQRQVIDYLVRQLVDSRPAGSPLYIESVDREPIETFVLIPEGKPGAGTFGPEPDSSRNETDEFVASRTFDRRDLVETTSFRIRFSAYTPTLRTFVNKIRNSGRPLVITSIDVGLTTPDIQKLLSSAAALAPAAASNGGGAPAVLGNFFRDEPVAPANGSKPANNEDKRVLVVPRKLSAFVVQVDYLSIPEEKPAVAPEGEPKK